MTGRKLIFTTTFIRHAATHTRTHAHTHARIHAHTHKHTHTHTHTHRPISPEPGSYKADCVRRTVQQLLVGLRPHGGAPPHAAEDHRVPAQEVCCQARVQLPTWGPAQPHRGHTGWRREGGGREGKGTEQTWRFNGDREWR